MDEISGKKVEKGKTENVFEMKRISNKPIK